MRPHQSLDPMSYEAFEHGRSCVSDSWVLNITTTMGTLRENLHRVDMKSLVARVKELGIAELPRRAIAELICDEFDLWEADQCIPTWILHIVTGTYEHE